MKKGKEWLKEEINKMMKIANYKSIFFSPRMSCILYADLIKVIDQLDEPELPVVPKWFADFIEERLESTSDGDLVMDLWVIYYHGDFPVKHYNWLRNNKELATRAILDGYTIEQPKLLTVIVKDYDKTIMSKQLPEDEVNKMMEGLE